MTSPRSIRSSRFLAFLAVVTVACGAIRQLSGQAPTLPRVPVLVELFTSEGCSDCPPADTLLGQLDVKQPIATAQAIVLSEHVTYWNRLGWRDPFSLDAMTERQEEYVRRFGLESSYTPQMVVDGASQFVGSNAKALVAAVADAARKPKQALVIENAKWDKGSALFAVHGDIPAGAKLFVLLAADATHQEVFAGENAGRTLHHVAVVRVMREFGSEVADGRPLKLSGGDLNHKDEASGPVRLVVFIVDRKTGHVLGAAEQALKR
jgi:hypothetical protein